MAERRDPAPPILRAGGFTLCDELFGVENQPRMSVQRLRELFFPDKYLVFKAEQEFAREEAFRLFHTPFLAAQILYYTGEAPHSKLDCWDMMVRLKEVVQKEYCRVPSQVERLEREMRTQYEPMKKLWFQQTSRYKHDVWSLGKPLGSQADRNPDHFLAHHFLHEGWPEPESKAPKPIVARDLQHRARLRRKAHRLGIPTAAVSSREGRHLILGWDISEVRRVAARVRADAECRRGYQKMLAQEVARMREIRRQIDHEASLRQAYRVPFAKYPTNGPYAQPGSRVPERLVKCVGSYELIALSFESIPFFPPNQDAGPHPFYLDVSFGPRCNIMQGALQFFQNDGTLLLAESEDVLRDYVGEDGVNELVDHDETTPQDIADAGTSHGKRRMFVRVKIEEKWEAGPRYCIWKGHLDFTDITWSILDGCFSPLRGGDTVRFRGMKIHAGATKRAVPWHGLSCTE